MHKRLNPVFMALVVFFISSICLTHAAPLRLDLQLDIVAKDAKFINVTKGGISEKMLRGTAVGFYYGGVRHLFTLLRVTKDNAIAATDNIIPEYDMSRGDSFREDLTGDGTPDIEIKMNGLQGTTYVNFSFMLLQDYKQKASNIAAAEVSKPLKPKAMIAPPSIPVPDINLAVPASPDPLSLENAPRDVSADAQNELAPAQQQVQAQPVSDNAGVFFLSLMIVLFMYIVIAIRTSIATKD